MYKKLPLLKAWQKRMYMSVYTLKMVKFNIVIQHYYLAKNLCETLSQCKFVLLYFNKTKNDKLCSTMQAKFSYFVCEYFLLKILCLKQLNVHLN